MPPAPINYNNAKDSETQMAYPEFFEIIRNHKAWRLHLEFEGSLRREYDEGRNFNRTPEIILKEYEKEKLKLMKELKPFKHLCKQPGSVIEKVMREHFHRPT